MLHMSKLILLRFMNFLHEHLIPDSYEIVYSGFFNIFFFLRLILCFSDTDSVCLCLEDELYKLVKPGFELSWEKEKADWFVMDHNNAWDIRCPGKMKLEWSSSNGAIIW